MKLVPGINHQFKWNEPVKKSRKPKQKTGSPTWTRTKNLAVNSRSLYRLSYRGNMHRALADRRARHPSRSGQDSASVKSARTHQRNHCIRFARHVNRPAARTPRTYAPRASRIEMYPSGSSASQLRRTRARPYTQYSKSSLSC